MSSVPYTFADSTGNIPLAYLDTNFSNVKAYADTAGTVTTAAQPNITSVGTLTSLSVTGNVTASSFIGNLTGSISNAVYANTSGTAGTVTTAAQPNITSVGTLSSLSVTGNVTIGSGIFIGNGAGLTNLVAANVSGTVANATYALTAGTVTTAAQPNITSVGTLSSLSVTGNVTGGNIVTSGVFAGSGAQLTNIPGANVSGTVATATTAGTVTTAAQPNITSVGTLSSLSVTGNITNSGNIAFGSASSGLLYVDTNGFSVLSSTANSGSYLKTNNDTLLGVSDTTGVLIITNFGNLVTNRTLNWNNGTLDLDLNGVQPGNIANVNTINFADNSKFSSAAWTLIETLTANFAGGATQMVTMGNTPATLQTNYNELYIRLQGPDASQDHTSTIIPTPDIVANSTVSLGILPSGTSASQIIWAGLSNASIRILQSTSIGGTGNIVIYAR